MRLFFDTETTGTPLEREADTHPGQPRLCELAATLYDMGGTLRQAAALYVRPDGWVIPANIAAIHGVSQDIAMEQGHRHTTVLRVFDTMMKCATEIIAHNIAFDLRIMRIAYAMEGWAFEPPVKQTCTMLAANAVVPTRTRWNGEKKWPSLGETYEFLFEKPIRNAHQGLADVASLKQIYTELRTRGVIA